MATGNRVVKDPFSLHLSDGYAWHVVVVVLDGESAQFDGWMDRRRLDSNIRCSKHERTRSHSKPATMTMTSTDNNVCHTRRHIDRSVLRTSVLPIIWWRVAAAAEGGRESESRSVARSEIEWMG